MTASLGFESTGYDVVAAFSKAAQGKTLVLTGPAPTGIGGETAVAFAHAGVTIIVLVGRSAASLQPVVERINAVKDSIVVIVIEADLSSQASVRAAATAILADPRVSTLDYIVNNAAIMAAPFRLTEDGVESHFAINFLAHFLLTNLLRPKWSTGVTVVNVAVDLTSSLVRLGERFDDVNFEKEPYEPLLGYANGKLAQAYFGIELARRGVRSLIVHPGIIITGLMKHVTPEVQQSSFKLLGAVNEGEFQPESPKSTAQGCATTLRAALDPGLPSGAFLKDCQVVAASQIQVADLDAKASKVWDVAERLVRQTFA